MSTAGDPLTGIPPGADNGDMPLHDDVAHPQVLANADPAQLWNAVYRAVEFLEDYGWWVLAALVLLYTVYVVLEAQIQAALARHRERQRLRRFEGNPHIAQVLTADHSASPLFLAPRDKTAPETTHSNLLCKT